MHFIRIAIIAISSAFLSGCIIPFTPAFLLLLENGEPPESAEEPQMRAMPDDAEIPAPQKIAKIESNLPGGGA
ncbi:MAG: hypothetical protein J6P03_07975 [Opitutales bacterium]|nr:hypothetical protein [Opitutales bacterium]